MSNCNHSRNAQPPAVAYTGNDFCRSIGCGRSKFYEMLRAGEIKTVRIGGRRLVPASEAQRLVTEAVHGGLTATAASLGGKQ